MRTTLELIALVVGFRERAQFIWCSDGDKPEKLVKLNKLIEDGGEPVGLVGVRIAQDIGSFYLRPLKEYEADETTAAYLKKLQGVIVRALAAKGTLLPNLHYGEGWIN